MTGDKITNIKGVGEKRARLFEKLGVCSVDALLHFYPRNYIDYSRISPIDSTVIGDTACVKATVVTKPIEHRVRKGMTLYKFTASDGHMPLKVTIFNNKYLAAKINAGDSYIFYGKVDGNLLRREMASPEILPPSKATIRPVYRQTEGLHSYMIEQAVSQALNNFVIKEYLPDRIREKYNLCSLKQALNDIHFPTDFAALNTARRRLVFDELFGIQIGMQMIKNSSQRSNSYTVTDDFTEQFESLLPFSFTGAQRRAVGDCIADMKRGIMMNRLIQGDVGSGKTAVAAAVCYTAIKNGMQAALMAPTEILAEQHFTSFVKMLSSTDVRVALLTGSTTAKARSELLSRLAYGDIDLLIGTHALIQDDVVFDRLGLVITDEQHRFGVNQRARLSAKGHDPHMLVMSATPIPRTLALMIYGDLDISALDELPPGRQAIETYVIQSRLHERAYGYIRKHLDEGRQGYIVCPLVADDDETDTGDMIAAEEYAQRLQNGPFAGYSVGLLHGKMKAAQKEQIMHRFAAGQIQLLVSTTVVEVGVDVPNAVIMMIENADRFGLSQLHQLRGRVGRGKHKSTCILVSDAQNEEAVTRLNVIKSTCDGFKISEEDLKLRGPGDFLGSRQHGLPALKIADVYADINILHETQQCAKFILDSDPELTAPENAELRRVAEGVKDRMTYIEMN